MPDPVLPTGAPDAATAAAAAEDARFTELLGRVLPGVLGRVLPKALEPHLPRAEAKVEPAKAAPPVTGAGAGGDDVTRQIEELRTALNKERDGRAAERRTQREQAAFGDLRAELVKAGVRPEGVDAAAKLLFHADKHVKVAPDGAATFQLGDQEYPSLAEGVQAWRKTPAAALFLPAPGYGAPGKRPQGPAARAPQRPMGAPPPPTAGAQREDPLAKTMRELGF